MITATPAHSEDRISSIKPESENGQSIDVGEDETSLAIPAHPLGILPLGNQYLSHVNLKNAAGVFSVLPDELLIQLLEHFSARDLVTLGSTCKSLFAFSRGDETWKNLLIESGKVPFKWLGTWFATYRGLKKEHIAKVDCHGLFSDVFHRPFACSYTPLRPFIQAIPSPNQVPLLTDLSPQDFAGHWVDKPFILTEPVKAWPVFSNWGEVERLAKYENTVFRAESVNWPLQLYVEYMNDNVDESPLYLFDRSFVEKTAITVGKEAAGDYWPPDCFGEDFFSVLGDQRPDRRWLIVGPERSGSTFHKDPNATSAWNAVLHGSKYWILFPSHEDMPPPPGVYVSEDQSEVTSPLSIAEWLLSFHAEARRTPGCMEGICSAGEVLHVPSGWWHLVVNLSPSIAITQNFVPEKHLPQVLDFMKNKPDQVSGFAPGLQNPYELFVDKMREQYPSALQTALGQMSKFQKGKKRKRTGLEITEEGTEKAKAQTFTFGFGDDDDDDADVP